MMAAVGASAITILLLSACAPRIDVGFPEEAAPRSTASATEPVVDAAPATASPAPASAPTAQGAAAAFRSWLTLTRTPDPAAACARLTPALATRMVAEINARGPLQVSSCDEMIAVTAELYRALDQDAQVEITVQQETATDATLLVTYLATGDCGTVVLTRPADTWILTDQSQECAG